MPNQPRNYLSELNQLISDTGLSFSSNLVRDILTEMENNNSSAQEAVVNLGFAPPERLERRQVNYVELSNGSRIAVQQPQYTTFRTSEIPPVRLEDYTVRAVEGLRAESPSNFQEIYDLLMAGHYAHQQAEEVAEEVTEIEAPTLEPTEFSTGFSTGEYQYMSSRPSQGRSMAIPVDYSGYFHAEPQRREPRRSEREMMMEIVRSENFPRPNFKDWSDNRELNNIIDDWYRNVEYKENWIFARREREGFNRRNIGQFSLDDVISRMTKRKNGHELDTDNSKFYDWKLGGTEWILRLELFVHEQYHFLICRYIHKPSNVEIKYDIRYWSQGSESFKSLTSIFSEQRNNESLFDRIIGNTCEPDHGEWHDEDEDYGEMDFDDEGDDF